ncbi:phosphopantothenoylcysteine decarboxylase domain-containing protein [Lacibacter sediminis]|uniref:Phosphopantothenoylcysteine decarboxylase n=1 Tax=Lacibacter sediminis TaxID=2760713 RepID=A0A7G5XDD9_9BACT|nr:phosphopantothenoylcysteine decarboxylase [Lacibacter sediminis]QNA43492.1 phosphopantothenoylcysteine decarboxylase [Lacibacter sediminis]
MLQGKNILITAGPTKEAIDPVRYISNHSSGKMGYAIADVCLQNGANVTLVSGPVCISLLHEHLKLVQVQSANEMYLACCRYFEEADIVVFAAAVADYRPAVIANQKIKKNDEDFFIRMVKNIDIAYEFGQIKQPHQLSVGFALETNNELQHAIGKLEKKNFDMVVLNSMNDAQAGFGFDTNKISIIRNDQTRVEFDLKPKSEVAIDIVNEAASLHQAKENFVKSLI